MTQRDDSTQGHLLGGPPDGVPVGAGSTGGDGVSTWSRPDTGTAPNPFAAPVGDSSQAGSSSAGSSSAVPSSAGSPGPWPGPGPGYPPPAPPGPPQQYGPLQPFGPPPSHPQAAAAPPEVPVEAEPPRPGPLVGWSGEGFPQGDAPPGTTATPARRRSRGLLALLVAGCLLAGLVAGIVGGVVQDRVLTSRTPISVQGSGTTSRPADSVAGVASAVLPSTVSIEVRSAAGQGSGSGFVLREDGMILTNNHVIAAAADGGEIVVVFSDGSQEPAEVVGRTSDYDLAVLRVQRGDLDPLPLGDSDAVVVGDPVIAVGAPLGLEATVTTGIVSALNRPVSAGGEGEGAAFINAIQTDAAINPGNSGGPLVNLDGEVIGINSAIARAPGTGGSAQSGNIGLGFAIPSEQAARTAQQLIDDGRATYPLVGVLLDRAYDGEGVRVLEQSTEPGLDAVTPGGPADAAGIRPGDVIVGFEGRPVTEPDQLIVAIRAQEPGDTVTLRVRTGDDEERDVDVVLDEAESDS